MIQRKAEKQSKLLEMVRKRVQKQTQKLRKESFLNSQQNEEFLEAEIGPESETEPALFSLDLLHQKEKQSMEELKRLFHHREVADPIESDRKSPFCYTEGYFYLENHEFHQGKNLEYNSANNLSDDECVENSKSKDCTDRVCESKEDHPNFSCIRAGKKDAKIRKAPETIPSQTRIENERYRQALITNLKQRARRRKMPIPTVCSCQKSSSDWKTFTCKLCAENCLFYKQPKCKLNLFLLASKYSDTQTATYCFHYGPKRLYKISGQDARSLWFILMISSERK
eukprot:Sdes_comp20837_c0_seq3m17506